MLDGLSGEMDSGRHHLGCSQAAPATSQLSWAEVGSRELMLLLGFSFRSYHIHPGAFWDQWVLMNRGKIMKSW